MGSVLLPNPDAILAQPRFSGVWLQGPNGEAFVGRDLNDMGVVVGSITGTNDDKEAAIWQAGTPTSLGNFRFSNSSASAVNNHGHFVVGAQIISPDRTHWRSHALRFMDGQVQWLLPLELGGLRGEGSGAADINDHVVIVGNSSLAVLEPYLG